MRVEIANSNPSHSPRVGPSNCSVSCVRVSEPAAFTPRQSWLRLLGSCVRVMDPAAFTPRQTVELHLLRVAVPSLRHSRDRGSPSGFRSGEEKLRNQTRHFAPLRHNPPQKFLNHHELLLPRQDPPWRLRNRRRESSLQSARHGGRSSCNNGGFCSFCTSGPSPFG